MSLYARITELHGDRPWGSVLDAGTGRASMRWLLGLPCERWTAVTGSNAMADAVRAEAGDAARADDRIVVGNWLDPDLLRGECFDTVLADYLIGAIEGFAPYWQDRLFDRLRPLVRRRLYVIGLEPYVPFEPQDEAGQLVVRIGRLRDACLLLAGDRPYREYPMEWVMRHLARSGFVVRDAQRVPIRYGERFINSQLDMSAAALDGLEDRNVAVALHTDIAQLRAQALACARRNGGLRHGHDYVLVAEPADGNRG